MPQMQSPGDIPDGGSQSLRKPLQREQKLMLLRAEAFGVRCLFTEMKKPADLVPEFGQCPEIIDR
jgi:hypothetical protein